MKKSLLITTSLLTLGVVTGIYAQSVGATGSVIDKMKAVAHSFTLGSTLNPTDTGLTSDPVKGKKSGDILTAGEWNRMLELMSEGGGNASSGSTEIVPGWPAGILCESGNTKASLYFNGISAVNFPETRVTYTAFADAGSHTMLQFNYQTGAFLSSNAITDAYNSAMQNCLNKNIKDLKWISGVKVNSGSGWVDVSLTGTENFDDSCMYRLLTSGGIPTSYAGTNYWVYPITVSPQHIVINADSGSVGHIYSASKNVYRVDGAQALVVQKMQKFCGGGSSSGGLSLYKCTNAQSLDATNAPCYGASRNGGAGTNQYRVVSCTDNDGTRSYTMSSILNFGQLVANKWAVSVNGGTIECDDGTILVMDMQSNSGGSSGPSSIFCRRRNSTYTNIGGRQLVKFTESDCGGVLPDASYHGALGSLTVCNGAIDHMVYDGGTTNGPGVIFSLRGGSTCTWPDGTGYDISVVYIK